MRSINVGGKIFKISKTTRDYSDLRHPIGRTIYDCYSKPSSKKVSIYNEWLHWAINNNVIYFGVASYNCNIFTLQGIITIDDDDYLVYITPSYNTLYPISK